MVAELALKDDSGGNKKPQKLSRPERKARERQRKQDQKQNRRRKHNYADRQATSQTQGKTDKDSLSLNSNAISKLTPQSTADDVVRAIKRAQNLHDHHDIGVVARFLIEETDPSFAYGYRGSLLSRLAVAALHMNSHALARKAIDARLEQHSESIMPMESAAIIRGLLRVHNVTDALFVLARELPMPREGQNLTEPATRELLKHRALALCSIASRHFFEGEPSMALLACQKIAKLGPIVRLSGLTAKELNLPWARILKGAAQCEAGRRDGSVQPCIGVTVENMPCNIVYAVLNAMTTFPSENSDRVYELLSNALVRRVVFVTGAIDMASCPPADRGEAAFIGRSNVGKSSLINMITNRKSLAYTSKRPGKTQQFNFFAINDKVNREKEIKYGDVVEGEKDPDSFNIVDLPGFGYAKVPDKVRQQWSDFMREYLSTRKTLRVVFHLVDGRHGPTDEDAFIMKQVAEELPRYATYVVVLTKADKNVKAASTRNSGKVSREVMDTLRKAMQENGVGSSPVILSSAETKMGRNDLWRYLRLAAEV